MDFSLTEDQKMLRAMVRDFAEKELEDSVRDVELALEHIGRPHHLFRLDGLHGTVTSEYDDGRTAHPEQRPHLVLDPGAHEGHILHLSTP